MKLKKKILSLGMIVAVSAPVALAVSCGSNSKIKWDINEEINGQVKNIMISKEDALIIEGSDGSGTFRVPLSAKTENLLKDANAEKKVEVLYFQEGSNAKWKDVTNKTLNNLSNYDQIKLSIKLNNDAYLINGKKSFELETLKIGESASSDYQLDKKWFKAGTQEPAKKIIKKGIVTTEGDQNNKKVLVDLDKMDKESEVNDLVMAIAMKLGYLFSENKLVRSFLDTDATNRKKFMHLRDIYDSLENAQKNNIKNLEVKYNGEISKPIELEDVLKGISTGENYIKHYKDAELENGADLAEIFIKAPKTTEFLKSYGTIVTPLTPELLSLISGMRDNKDALRFFPELAVNYGDIFKEFSTLDKVTKWSEDNKIRDREIKSIPQIFMTALFRNE